MHQRAMPPVSEADRAEQERLEHFLQWRRADGRGPAAGRALRAYAVTMILLGVIVTTLAIWLAARAVDPRPRLAGFRRPARADRATVPSVAISESPPEAAPPAVPPVPADGSDPAAEQPDARPMVELPPAAVRRPLADVPPIPPPLPAVRVLARPDPAPMLPRGLNPEDRRRLLQLAPPASPAGEPAAPTSPGTPRTSPLP
jgi:hypothetical protein